MSNTERRILTPKGLYQIIEQLTNADSRVGGFRLGDIWMTDQKIDVHPVVIMEHRGSSLDLNMKTNDFNRYDITLYCFDQPRSDRSDIVDIKSSTHAILNDLVLNLRDNPTIKQLGVRIPAGQYSFQYHLMKGNEGLVGTSITLTVTAPTLLCYSNLPQNVLEAIDSGCQTCSGTAPSYTFDCSDLEECQIIQDIQTDIETLFTLTGGTTFDCSILTGCTVIQDIQTDIDTLFSLTGSTSGGSYLPLSGGTITGNLDVTNLFSVSGIPFTDYFLSTGTTFGDGLIRLGLDSTQPYIALDPHLNIHTLNADESISISGVSLYDIFISEINAGNNISILSGNTVALNNSINVNDITVESAARLNYLTPSESTRFAVIDESNTIQERFVDPSGYLLLDSDSTQYINSDVVFSGESIFVGGLSFPELEGKWPVLYLNGDSQMSTNPSFIIDISNTSALTYNLGNIVTSFDVRAANVRATSGGVFGNTLSASTSIYANSYFSGGTPLQTVISSMISSVAGGLVDSVNAGTNINITGTAADPIVNLNNNVSVTNMSATTYWSGSTPLTTIINTIAASYASSGGTTSGDYLPLSGGTVTGDTYFEGDVYLNNQAIFQGTSLNELLLKKLETVTIKTTPTYTASTVDMNTMVAMSSTTAQQFIIASAETFYTGAQILVTQDGVGQTRIVAGAGVTIQSYGNARNLVGQYSTAFLTHRGSNRWTLDGNLTNIEL